MFALQPSTKLLDSLSALQASPHLGLFTATLNRVTGANDAFLDMIGHSRADMEAGLIDWRDLTCSKYRPLDEQVLAEVQQFGASVPFEKECVRRDGTCLPVLMAGVRLGSEPLEWACWVVDLRNRNGADDAKRKARELQLELDAELRGAIRNHEMATRLLQKYSMDDLMGEILDAAIDLTKADFGTIQVLESDALRIVAHRGFDEYFVQFFRTVSHSTPSVCGAALGCGSRVVIDDVATDELFNGTDAREVLLGAGVRAVQSTPLTDGNGKVIGMLATHFRTAHTLDERAFRYLDLLAVRAAILIERMQKADLERTAAALASKAEIANVLAHEINNPAQALTLVLDLLSSHEMVHGEARKLVDVAQQQLARICDKARALLEIGSVPRTGGSPRKTNGTERSTSNAVDAAGQVAKRRRETV